MDIEVIVNGIINKLDDTNKALMSEDIIALKSAIKEKDDRIESLDNDVKALKNEKEELLKVNGKLYRRIGETLTNDNSSVNETKKVEDKLELSKIINEKGELI